MILKGMNSAHSPLSLTLSHTRGEGTGKGLFLLLSPLAGES
jgi:hypothetical protein